MNGLPRDAPDRARPLLRPGRWPLAMHAALTRWRSRRAPHHRVATKLDHYFIASRPPVAATAFAGRLIDPWTLCRLAWWVRGARLELLPYGPRHLAIAVTYPGLAEPNVEVSLRAEEGGLRLELEGVYLFDLKGAGLGACAMLHCALAAQALGCERIATQGSGAITREGQPDVGYYAWPRMGFDAPLRLALQNRLAREAPHLAGCATVREVLETDKHAWRRARATVPLGFRLAPEALDLAYLRAYLAGRGLLA